MALRGLKGGRGRVRAPGDRGWGRSHRVRSAAAERHVGRAVDHGSRCPPGGPSGGVNGHPSHQRGGVGITGTNEKTTSGYLVSAIPRGWGNQGGGMGTVPYRTGNRDLEAKRTTPEGAEVESRWGR